MKSANIALYGPPAGFCLGLIVGAAIIYYTMVPPWVKSMSVDKAVETEVNRYAKHCQEDMDKWSKKFTKLLWDSGCSYDDIEVLHCPWEAE